MAARLTGTIRKQNFIDLFFLVKERGGGASNPSTSLFNQNRLAIRFCFRPANILTEMEVFVLNIFLKKNLHLRTRI